MINHDKCAAFEEKIIQLEKTVKDTEGIVFNYFDQIGRLLKENTALKIKLADQEEQLIKSYEKLQDKLEENTVLVSELEDARKELLRSI